LAYLAQYFYDTPVSACRHVSAQEMRVIVAYPVDSVVYQPQTAMTRARGSINLPLG
jgi:hypothetical protein